ncbi:MAG: hypothetical protein NTV86_07325 [Planctomycetota bacterium]|nr:hypothetical protein [Planctomycetota bacterium]
MRFMSLAMSAALFVTTLVAPAAGEAPLAEKIPAGAIVYVGWAGKTPALDGSALGQLLAGPGVSDLLTMAKTALRNEVPPRDHAALERFWSALDIAWRHPAAMAVLDVRKNPKDPVDLVAVIDLGADRDAFAEHLDAAIQAGAERKHWTLEQASAGGVAYQRLLTRNGDAPAVAIGYVGKTFFLAVGANVVEKLVALAPEKSLRADAAFQAAHKAVAADKEQLSFCLDVAKLTTTIKAMMPSPATEAAASQPARNPVDAVMAALGVSKITTIAGSMGVVGKDLLTQVRLVSPAPHKGLLMLAAGAPLADNALAHVPGDAHLAAAWSLSPEALYAEVLDVAQAAGWAGGDGFAAGEKRVQEMLGLSLREEILPAFGDTWVLASAPSWGGTLTGTMLTVSVKDPAKAAAVTAGIEGFLARMLVPPPAPAADGDDINRPVPRPRKSWSIERRKVGQTTVTFLLRRGEMMPVSPAWAIHEGRLYVALWPQVIESAIVRQAPGADPAAAKTVFLPNTPAYAALKRRVGPGASALMYVNGAALVKDVYNILLIGWSMVAGELTRQAPGLARSTMPALTTLEAYLQPEMAAVIPDAGGITYRAQSTLGGLSGAAALVPAAAAVALPVVANMIESARKTASAANLRAIGMGCRMYMMENNEQTPPNLDALVAGSFIPPQSLGSPADRSPNRARLENGKVVGQPSYIYISGLDLRKDPAPSQRVWAYERPEIYGNEGTNVLFLDGSVRWMPMAAFRRALATGKAPATQKGEAAMEGNLAVLRNALEMYAAEHDGKGPGPRTIVGQLTQYTSASGAVSATKDASHPYGPYLQGIPAMPTGPWKGAQGIGTAAGPGIGWIYDPATQTIKPSLDERPAKRSGGKAPATRPAK